MLAKSWLVRLPIGIPFLVALLLSLSLSLSARARIATNKLIKKTDGLFVLDPLFEDISQYILIHTVKEFSYVAFQNKTRPSIICGYFSDSISHIQHASMRSFTYSAGKGCRNKCGLEDRIQNSKYRMVKDPVSDSCLINVAKLRVADPKGRIRSMFVGMGTEIVVKVKKIFLKFPLEPCHVGLFLLVTFKGFPRFKQVVG